MDFGIAQSTDASSLSDILSDTGNFECNICFELAQDPIVTLCGHLYCWSCLYQWLQIHSHSHECPVCKALVEEDKLVPIYGRGKSSFDPRTRLISGVSIPNRPMGQRPQTARRVGINFVRQNDLDPISGLMPMGVARFGHQVLSNIFGALPAIFNLQLHDFHDATVYGTTSGTPNLFSSSFHGGYVHGFHHYHLGPIEWKPIAWKLIFVVLVFLLETSENESGVRGANKKLQVPIKTNIVAPEPGGAPVVSEKGGGGSGGAPLKVPRSKKDSSWLLKGFSRKALAALSNLPLAIAEMFALAALMAVGTVIEQREAPDFYFQKHSLSWDSLHGGGFSPLVLTICFHLRWSFVHSPEAIHKQDYSDTLPRASIQDLGIILCWL
ncbi:uncharacterized protein [Primulina eburnea]|uniref:uncharacterized protein isoform X2 n=1 Tax=Primulina eburnea TaxID=1245227 RepID=UPI003C6CAFB5